MIRESISNNRVSGIEKARFVRIKKDPSFLFPVLEGETSETEDWCEYVTGGWRGEETWFLSRTD